MSTKTIYTGLFIIIFISGAFAQVPQAINYQSFLTDSNGDPVNGIVSIIFRIYDAESGGTELWNDTHSVNVTDGILNAILGAPVKPIPYTVFEGSDRYLALKVGNDSEMTPRTRLVSVGYAYRAYDADKVDGIEASAFVQSVDGVPPNSSGNIDLEAGSNVTVTPDAANNKITISATGGGGGGDSDWTISGDNMYSAVSGNVGIGTTGPGVKLHISDIDPELKISSQGSSPTGRGRAFLHLERGGAGKDNALVTYSDGTSPKWNTGFLYNYGKATANFHISQKHYISDGSQVHTPELTITTEGFVGIGTAAPAGGLHVSGGGGNGTALFERSGKILALNPNYGGNNQYAHVSTGVGSHKGLKLDTNESTAMTVTTDGYIGIGTMLPESRLHVVWDSYSLGTIRGDATGQFGRGIYGKGSGTSGKGVYGFGEGSSADGVYGAATGFWGKGVVGEASGDYGMGVLGIAGGANAYAGKFEGRLFVTEGIRCNGVLSKGGGSFMIDHPLDPENKLLYHSFVESPDMKNIYDGNVVTDGSGYASVQLPEWFDALNREFRYQLTVIGEFAQAIVYEKISNNRFSIKTDKPNIEVSWQVTGIRQDAFANKNRIPVEEMKEQQDRGKYLHPEAFNMPENAGIHYEERDGRIPFEEGGGK